MVLYDLEWMFALGHPTYNFGSKPFIRGRRIESKV
jgi:hypothetical protein